jgi:hypothetical protein
MKMPMAAPIRLPIASAGFTWATKGLGATRAIGAYAEALRPLGAPADRAMVTGLNAKPAGDDTGLPPRAVAELPPPSTGPPTAMLPLGPTRTTGGAPVAAYKVFGVMSAAKVNAGATGLATRGAGCAVAGDGESLTAPVPAAARTPAANAAVNTVRCLAVVMVGIMTQLTAARPVVDYLDLPRQSRATTWFLLLAS